MGQLYSLKIDAYAHIVPPKYKEVLFKVAPEWHDARITGTGPLHDLDARFRIMDRYEPLRQVLTLGWPALENISDAGKAVELARIANDEMAELVLKYPDRFVAAIAILPMNNMEEALKEADRAINDLKFRGVYIYTPINDKPPDLPEFMPLYEKMSGYHLPIFVHPIKWTDHPDYLTEKESKYGIVSTFGWPYDTTAFMTRLVFSGIMEEYPNLKVLTHHCGGMVPYFADRIAEFAYARDSRAVKIKGGVEPEQPALKRDVIDYYKMFYADTALYGNPSALMCGYTFFGPDHILFGCDFPLGLRDPGNGHLMKTINAIEQMEISDADSKKIYQDNARRLMRLPI